MEGDRGPCQVVASFPEPEVQLGVTWTDLGGGSGLQPPSDECTFTGSGFKDGPEGPVVFLMSRPLK